MGQKRLSVFIVSIFLFSLVSSVQASEDSDIVAQFGTGFDEVVIADSTDGLFDPRDLEFHPGRTDELWIANRGDDSISIIHDTGLDTQYSQNREDSNSNHFLEEVSAIALAHTILNSTGSGARLKKPKTPTVVKDHQISSWAQPCGHLRFRTLQ